MLAQALIVAEQERLVLPKGAAQRSSKLVSLEWRCRTLIEVIRRIERIVSQELIRASMQLVRT